MGRRSNSRSSHHFSYLHYILFINKRTSVTLSASSKRGATPMPAALHGLLRVFPVLHRPGRARTSRTRKPAALRCAGSRSAASAKQRACRQRSLPGRLRTPRTASRARGLRPKKPSADRESSKGSRTGLVVDRCIYHIGMGSVCFSAEGGGFFRLAPSHA